MKQKPWRVTTHAIDRWIERVNPSSDGVKAVSELLEVMKRAKHVGTADHKNIYRDPQRPMDYEILARGHVIITILDPKEQPLVHGRESALDIPPRSRVRS